MAADHAVIDQDVHAQKKEQQKTAEDVDCRLGHLQEQLGVLAADIGQCHDKAGKQDADRVQSAKKGNNDRRKTVANGQCRDKLANGT